MTFSTRFKRTATVVAALSLSLAGGAIVAPAASAAPGATVDYYADTYPGVGADSVFTSVTFERFERLLQSDGKFAFVFGGPSSETIQATLPEINTVAKSYGIDEIYVFDPVLDGTSIDIRTSSVPEAAALWERLKTEYLNKDTTPGFTGAASDPHLFIYDRSNTVSGAEDRVVSQLAGAVSAADLASAEARDAYRAQVAAVFDAASGTPGSANFSTQSQFEFFSAATNQRHAAQYADASLYGGDIFTAEDAAGFTFQSVTYPELIHLLESDGEHTILFGGTWCHNTRAVVKEVNARAAATGVNTVYVFDLRLDGWSAPILHVRDTNSPFAHVYGELVAKHLPNLRTQYVTDGSAGQRVEYYPGGNTAADIKIAKKLQVPYLISYDKSRGAKPIVKDWIQDNGDGTFREFMTEWWWLQDLPGGAKRPNQSDDAYQTGRQNNFEFADAASAKLRQFFGQPALTATVPEAPAAPTVEVDGQNVTVSWAAHPATGGANLTGFKVSLGAESVDVPVGSSWSHTFEKVAPGTHQLTLSAVNSIGSSLASEPVAATIAALPVDPEPVPVDPTPEEPGTDLPGSGDPVTVDDVVSLVDTGDVLPKTGAALTGSLIALIVAGALIAGGLVLRTRRLGSE